MRIKEKEIISPNQPACILVYRSILFDLLSILSFTADKHLKYPWNPGIDTLITNSIVPLTSFNDYQDQERCFASEVLHSESLAENVRVYHYVVDVR